MKKIIFSLAILLSVSAIAATPPVDEKLTKSFEENFPHANNTKWYEYENSYEVFFETNGISCRIVYDLKGNVQSVRRDYLEKDLPIYIMVKAKEKYKGKKIYGVTELTSPEGVSYTIIMEDEKKWLTVKSDASGNMAIMQKLEKS